MCYVHGTGMRSLKMQNIFAINFLLQGEESSLPPRYIFVRDLQGVKISDLFNLEVHNLFQERIFICYKSLDFTWCTKHFMMTRIIYYVKKRRLPQVIVLQF